MDKVSTDAEFDSYWDNEAKNQNRNRIRVGRQYQAQIPPRLKPGEKDGRKSSELETLKWKPDQIADDKVEEYLSMAKGVGLFSKSVASNAAEKSEITLQSAIKGLSEFVTSHHPCHHDDGCKMATASSSTGECSTKVPINDWTPSEALLFGQALESCGKNFCAIKKEFLPWKPVRSIIEYYYHGKGEKSEGECNESDLPSKVDDPGPSSSREDKPLVKDEPMEDTESPNSDIKNPTVNFLDKTRVTDPCGVMVKSEFSVTDAEAAMASSTIGSLKFFLGGRLVLKLNAQQDGGSGEKKCQWVQSSELPRIPGVRKERHRKKSVQRDSPPLPVPPKPRTNAVSETTPKKPKSEYDFASEDKNLLQCSTPWLPPVADGQESLAEMDDGSSKTSEGYEMTDSPDCSRSTVVRGSPNGSPFKSEVLTNHKSALRSPVRTIGGGHRGSPLLKSWVKWPSYPVNASSPCSLSPVLDLKSPMKENPLDLSSKVELISEASNHLTNAKRDKLTPPDLDVDSSQSSNLGHSLESPSKDPAQCDGPEKDSEDSSQYCNLPYQCALAKCTKDYPLEEVPLDLSSASESLKDRTDGVEELENAMERGTQNNEAVEHGMLYQLLKNNSGK